MTGRSQTPNAFPSRCICQPNDAWRLVNDLAGEALKGDVDATRVLAAAIEHWMDQR